MSTIQNLKNFIRHGKQARAAQPAHGEPATGVSNVHAHHSQHHHHQKEQQKQQQQQQRHNVGGTANAPQHHAHSEPNVDHHHRAKPLHADVLAADYSVGALDNRHVGARAADAAARAAGDHQKLHQPERQHQNQQNQKKNDGNARAAEFDPTVLERIVAEERESQGKLPRYPGLDRWILLEKMGDGAFSNVYRAKDGTGRVGEVAIKVVRKFEMNATQGDNVLHPDFKKEPKAAERANILKEVQIMRQLDHPNIVKLVEFSESRQYYYIILELCPGGELFHQIVRLTYFSEDLSRHVIVQVAKALEYLHEEAGVVHRDIKPENLLFYPVPFIPTRNPKPKSPEDEDKADEGEFVKGVGSGGIGTIKLADFGLSKVVWDRQTMTPCGTVGYTAPEIVKDERYSKSVDMWALGCVLYTLLCGFPPFYDESIQVLTEKVARGQYTFLSPWWDDISKSAQDLVSHLLTVDPDKRYDIRQFLAHPWIRETEEETWAAADAPPLATPLYRQQKQLHQPPQQQQPQQQQMLHPDFSHLESPMTAGATRRDFRSPGAVNLREVFDVSYAVHRQEEESKRRKNFKQGYRGAAGAGTNLNPLDEDTLEEEDEEDGYDTVDVPVDSTAAGGAAAGGGGSDMPASKVPRAGQGASDVAAMEQKLRHTTLSAAAQARQQQNQPQRQKAPQQQQRGYGQHSPAVAAAARQQVKSKGAFELSLDGATLLGKRAKKPDPSRLREEIQIR